MAENRLPPDLEHLNRPEARHESSDVNVGALTKMGIAFVLAGIAMLFLVFWVFDYLKAREETRGAAPSRILDRDARALPPEPRLQATPIEDLQQMRAAEEQILNSYGWIDQAHGLVRIPIARAMQQLAAEGLPHRAQPGPITTDPATVPTESGLGPIVQQSGGPLSPNRRFPPDQPLEIHGTGSFADGRQAGGPPTPPEFSLGK